MKQIIRPTVILMAVALCGCCGGSGRPGDSPPDGAQTSRPATRPTSSIAGDVLFPRRPTAGRMKLLDLQRDYLEHENAREKGLRFARLLNAMRVVPLLRDEAPLSELEVLELLGPPDNGWSDRRGAVLAYVCGHAYIIEVGPDGLVKSVGSADVAEAHLNEMPRWAPYYQSEPLPSGRSYLGILFAEDAERTGGPDGLRVAGIFPNSPASKSILKTGDLIVSLDATPIGWANAALFRKTVAALPPGHVATVRFLRPEGNAVGSSREVKLVVGVLQNSAGERETKAAETQPAQPR